MAERSGDGSARATSDRTPRTRLTRSIAHRLPGDGTALPVEGHLPTFAGATSWLNSGPLTPEGLRGRVVLVDFWTYTCVNWLRTLPYLRAWDDRYRDQGLTIVGVHTPEFGFERTIENVVEQARRLEVRYPVAVDSEYGVWRAFANHYWPAVYLADADGRIRYHHFGEGEYAMTEMVIQQLLLDAGAPDVAADLVTVEPAGLEVPADWATLRSPETYVRAGEDGGVGPRGRSLALNTWNLSGDWTITPEAGVLTSGEGVVAFRFHARDLNLVMGPTRRGSTVPFRVTLDGQPLDGQHGADVARDGSGMAGQQRTYQLIRQSGTIVDRTFEIEYKGHGVAVHCFTFG